MWPFRRRRKPNAGSGNGGAAAARAAAVESVARKRAAEKMTPAYQEWAEHLASLPAEDLVERVARMFGGRA